jgi:hypothetical protein
MRLITKAEIEGFRSIQKADTIEFADFSALAGLNNSGKSNVLRALNAFFNDETDLGQFLNVDRDYHRQDLRLKKRKRIRVTLHFKLPTEFRFRKDLRYVQDFLGGNSFSITKEWTRDQLLPIYSLNGSTLNLENQQKITQFMSLIKFRYIPNRVLPTEVIRNEHKSLRNVLIRRLAKRAEKDSVAFKAIQSASAKLIESLVKRFKEACPGEGDVKLATPTSWQDMAFAFGYRLIRDDIEIEDIAQGSGIQSLLMLETLYLVDLDYFQQFGWRQAAIWAIEEPESSLHASLEARVGAYLSSICSSPSSRLQLLCTTHSDIVMQYANQIIEVDQFNGRSKFLISNDPKSSIERLCRTGVSRWIHPILYYPLDPVLIVDGKFDEIFWREAFKILNIQKLPIVTYLEQLDPAAGTGGNSNTYNYIKTHLQAIKSRRKNAPICVILDWEDQSWQNKHEKLFEEGDPFFAMCWPVEKSNPKLSNSFKGGERFYSNRIIEAASKSGLDLATHQDGHYSIDTKHYNENGKRIISEQILKGLEETDLVYAKEFIIMVIDKVGLLGQ